jgi:hypothetical protein
MGASIRRDVPLVFPGTHGNPQHVESLILRVYWDAFTARELPVNSPGSRVLAPRAAGVFGEGYRATWWPTMFEG